MSYANVMATVAVFIALGGTGYAAVKVTGRNVVDSSLTGRDVKDGSLDGSDVRDGGIEARDIKAGTLGDLKGAKGDKGDAGTPGAAATSLWAAVESNGTIARSKGLSGVTRVSDGRFSVTFNQDVTGCLFLATAGDIAAAGPTPGYAEVTPRKNEPNAVLVNTRTADGAGDSDRDFYVAVFC